MWLLDEEYHNFYDYFKICCYLQSIVDMHNQHVLNWLGFFI